MEEISKEEEIKKRQEKLKESIQSLNQLFKGLGIDPEKSPLNNYNPNKIKEVVVKKESD